jgi:hypothetical protein
VQLTDPGVEWIPPAPIPAVFRAGSVPQVKLLSTDSTDALPNGWTRGVTFSGVPGDPDGFSFYLPYTGGATQYLSDLAEVPAVTPMAQYMPLPSGTPQSAQVPAATGTGEVSAWTTLTAASVGADASGAAVTAQSNAETFATSAVAAETNRAAAAEALLAPKASPVFTGTPTAPTQSAGDSSTKIATDAFVATALAGADLSVYLAPSGATGETFPRQLASGSYLVLTSEQIYGSAIPLPAGLPVNHITLQVGGQAASGTVSHGWYALLDSGLVVRAVSADQTSGGWSSTFTPVTLSVAASGYTTTYGGCYYIAVCITGSSTMPEFPTVASPIGGLASAAPILAGTSGPASTTTPPSPGATLTALTSASDRFYAYTS